MVRSICAILAALWSVPAAAQNYPARPIRFIVPLAPAGAGDIVARTVAAKLSELWGQQIVIDNRPGANTIIGTDLVAKSKPDGYTWLLGVQGSLAINPATYPSLPTTRRKTSTSHANDRLRLCARRASGAAREVGRRVDRARALPSGRTRLRHVRQWRIEPSGR